MNELAVTLVVYFCNAFWWRLNKNPNCIHATVEFTYATENIGRDLKHDKSYKLNGRLVFFFHYCPFRLVGPPFWDCLSPILHFSLDSAASCLLGSVLTLSTLSLERVYAVLCPLRAHRGHFSPFVALGAVWLVSMLAAAPFCVLNEYRVYQVSKQR